MKRTAADRFNLHAHGMMRVGVASPQVRVADVAFNARAARRAIEALAAAGADLAVLPELCLTSYSCGDLFYQKNLLQAAKDALKNLVDASKKWPLLACVGLPYEVGGRLFNMAAVFGGGRLWGLVPKTHLPNGFEFYEGRWFAEAACLGEERVDFFGTPVPAGADLLFEIEGLPQARIGVEICEDLWAPLPPSAQMALAGANVLANLSASNALLGKARYRGDLVSQQSARLIAAYAYANAGAGESTSDLVFCGQSLIAENGALLAQTPRFDFELNTACADVDLDFLLAERRRHRAFSQSLQEERSWRIVRGGVPLLPVKSGLLREVESLPFVPQNAAARAAHCAEAFDILACALATRLRHIGAKKIVLGISGGLDSTLAFLVAARAFDALGLPRSGLVAVTLPGFGTTSRTRSNAEALASLLGARLVRISIAGAVRGHFKDIGHDEALHDITYENAQARERTQILMDLANAQNALCLGTGDLSEIALGWCTYNGDQMSGYHINAGVPKTLVRHMVAFEAERLSGRAKEVLLDVVATPVSPELLPLDKKGAQAQSTEGVLGPYELHDFFLYHFIRRAARPAKILLFAQKAFGKKYGREEILRCMEIFARRFFSQQFKRAASPDGPKLGSVGLSPRGDWRMPSDACAALWLGEIDALKKSRPRA